MTSYERYLSYTREKPISYSEMFAKADLSQNKLELNFKNQIKKVIFNDPATIVFWNDGSKTVTKCGEMDIYDPEKGLAMCFAKRLLGNEGNYYNVFKQWLPREEDEDSLFNRVDFTANICPDSYKSLITGMKDAVNKLTFSVDLSPDNSHPYPTNKKGDNDNG